MDTQPFSHGHHHFSSQDALSIEGLTHFPEEFPLLLESLYLSEPSVSLPTLITDSAYRPHPPSYQGHWCCTLCNGYTVNFLDSPPHLPHSQSSLPLLLVPHQKQSATVTHWWPHTNHAAQDIPSKLKRGSFSLPYGPEILELSARVWHLWLFQRVSRGMLCLSVSLEHQSQDLSAFLMFDLSFVFSIALLQHPERVTVSCAWKAWLGSQQAVLYLSLCWLSLRSAPAHPLAFFCNGGEGLMLWAGFLTGHAEDRLESGS